MALVYQMSFGKYNRRIRGLFYTHLQQIIDPHKEISFHTIPSENIKTLTLKIVFHGNSVLEGFETIIDKKDVIEITRYSYTYRRPSGFFFQYEMERPPKRENEIIKEEIPLYLKKPCCHLHVGAQNEIADTIANFPPGLREHDGPHYGTYPVSIDYVLAIIIFNFFSNKIDVLSTLKNLDLPSFVPYVFGTAFQMPSNSSEKLNRTKD